LPIAVADRPTDAAPSAPAAQRSRAAARAGLAVLVGLVAACTYALFADAAAAVPEATWLQVGLAAVALVALVAWVADRRPAAETAAKLPGDPGDPTGAPPGFSLAAPTAAWPAVAALVLLAVWSAIAIAWSATPDVSWDAANRDIAYALATAAAIAAGASAPRALSRAAVGVVLAVTLAALWALAGAIAPGVWDDAAREARLHAPLPDFLDLALVCALAAPVAVRLAASGLARLPLRLAALAAALVLVVALGMTFSRAGVLALAAGLLVAIVTGGARLRALFAAAGALLAAAAPLAVAFASDALTTSGAPLADRIDAGRTFGLVLLAALAVLLAVGWAAMRAEPRALAAMSPRRATAAGLAVAALALAALLAGVGALAASDRGLAGSISHAADTLTAATPAPRTGDDSRLLATDSGGRRLLWSEAAGAVSARPVAGWGPGAWPVIHARYRAADVPARDARSTVLQVLAERGAVGLALLALALALLVGAVIARLRALPPGPPRDLTAAALGAAAAWLAGATVVSAWELPAVTLPVLVLLGVAAARPGIAAHAPAFADPDPAARGGRGAALVLGAAALAIVATSALLPAWSQQRADAALRVASDPTTSADELDAAAADARLSSKLDPPAIGPQFAAAAVAQRRGRLLEARGELLQAVREQPDSAAAWARLSTLALTMADRDGALAAARRALELDPHSPQLIALARAAEAAQVPPASSPTATGTPLPDFVVR
jgi:hypothetical protein